MNDQRESLERAVRRVEATFVLIDPAYASRRRFVEIDVTGLEPRLDWTDAALYLLPPLG